MSEVVKDMAEAVKETASKPVETKAVEVKTTKAKTVKIACYDNGIRYASVRVNDVNYDYKFAPGPNGIVEMPGEHYNALIKEPVTADLFNERMYTGVRGNKYFAAPLKVVK